MKQIILSIGLLAMVLAAKPQEMYPVWANSIGGPGWDIARSMCVTPDSCLLITGTFSDSISMGGEWYHSNGNTDVYVAKYSSEGELLNSFTFGSDSRDVVDFAVCDDYTVLVVRHYKGMEIQGTKIDSLDKINYTALWFDDGGKLLCSQTIGGAKGFSVSDVQSGNNGTVYLVGNCPGALKIGSETTDAVAADTPFVLSFTKNGKVHSFKTLSEMAGYSINRCLVSTGNSLLISGISTDSTDTNAQNPHILYHRLFTATIGSNGEVTDWQTLLKGVSIEPLAMSVVNDYLWVAVRFKYHCVLGTDTLKAKGQNDILLAKIPSSKKEETQLWRIGGYANDRPLGLAASGEQAVLTGSFADTIWFGDDNYLVSEEQGSDLFLAVFSDSQVPVKTLSLGGIHNDFPMATVASDAGVYLLGQFNQALEAEEVKLETIGSYDVFVARYENCGAKEAVKITAQAKKSSSGTTTYQLTAADGYVNYQWDNGLGVSQTATAALGNTYSVEATDIYGCSCTGEIDLSDEKSASLDNTILEEDEPSLPFKLYPTVTSGKVYWQPGSSYPAGGATLKVCDMTGRTVLLESTAESLAPAAVQTLDMGALSKGAYMVELSGSGYNQSVKVIVK